MSNTLWENYSDQSDVDSNEDDSCQNSYIAEATRLLFLRKYKSTNLPEEALIKIFEESNYNDIKIQENLHKQFEEESKSYLVIKNPFLTQKKEEKPYKKNYKSNYYALSYHNKSNKNFNSSKNFYKPQKHSYYNSGIKKKYEDKYFYTQEVELNGKDEEFSTQKEIISKEYATIDNNVAENCSKEEDNEKKLESNPSIKSENETSETMTNNGSEENDFCFSSNKSTNSTNGTGTLTYYSNTSTLNTNFTEEYFSSPTICSNFVPKPFFYDNTSYNNFSGSFLPGIYYTNNNQSNSKYEQEKCWERVAMYYDCFKKENNFSK